LGGALLDELVLRGKLRVGSSSKLELVDSIEMGDALLDKAIFRFQHYKECRKICFCIELLNRDLKKHKKGQVKRLISEGVLSQGENGLAWALPFADSLNPNASAKFLLKNRLRELVLMRGEPELPDLALLDLAKASKLLGLIFTKDERKSAQHWIHASLMSKALNDPDAQSVQEIDIAVDSLVGNS
jgi:hypothetical protein